MNIAAAQREIDSILKILNDAKSHSGCGPHDPSVIALERIMVAKVAELEAAKTKAAQQTEAPSGDDGTAPHQEAESRLKN